MSTGRLTIDLAAIAENWRALDARSAATVETAATVKADGYGLGIGPVARALHAAGARSFFVAVAEEGAALREAVGPNPRIFVYGGHMPGDTDMIGDLGLIPLLNSIEQMTRHFEALPGAPFGIQLDSDMNRLGMEAGEWLAVRDLTMRQGPQLIMSHLACADEPDRPMNRRQLDKFREMTRGLGVPLSIAATGGTLLGPDYHFDMTRPGIGLYGGMPFADAAAVVRLSLPVIQVRDVEKGEPVGYGNTWWADKPTRLATVAAGYADGIHRALSNKAVMYHGTVPCPVVGRVSMDLITVDISGLDGDPQALDLLSTMQTVDDVADNAGTIGYEILTSLGPRYTRRYTGLSAS
ncbi:alanine racemase [Psychromarinibacter sp. C21-152]|uniref:Alanine racemase n=1 Tax=Psychromarinibacter sediminicola TaxID=3033385 RepID=A0AAE3T9Y5_9RHOB|nr:alanine racemase [Psychromarinibacter sediminicola]MDF0602722.1 alanine racemase [Psychromarinibacter sediminicola]